MCLHVLRQFHRLHSKWVQMTNATAINAVQVDSFLLIQWIVVHGRSSLMESFVWFIPFMCVKRREKREDEIEKKRENERENEREDQESKRK